MSSRIQAVGGAVISPVGLDHRRAHLTAAAPAAKPVVAAESTAVAVRKLQDALQEIARYLQQNQTGLEFRVDNDSGRVIVSIVDPEDGTVIRQIPSDEALRIADLLARQAKGLVDTRA